MIRVLPVPFGTASVPIRFRFLREPVLKNQEPELKISKCNLVELTSLELLLLSLVLSRSKSERSFEWMR